MPIYRSQKCSEKQSAKDNCGGYKNFVCTLLTRWLHQTVVFTVALCSLSPLAVKWSCEQIVVNNPIVLINQGSLVLLAFVTTMWVFSSKSIATIHNIWKGMIHVAFLAQKMTSLKKYTASSIKIWFFEDILLFLSIHV